MRWLLTRRGPAVGLLVIVCGVPAPASAQQGSLQVTAATQTVHGDPSRIAGYQTFEPDFGVSWLQPGTRFGMFQIELRGTRREGRPHLGKAFLSLRDFKRNGVAWSFEAGDTYFTPAIGEYRFSNLATPALTFAGASVKAQTPRTVVTATAGRSTAWRNLFGTDPDTLDQNLAVARVAHKASDRVEVSARASFIRTDDLKEFGYTIDASDQGGAATRIIVTPALHVVGDVSLVSYRRRGEDTREMDGSGLVGASFLLGRGWFQVNASRFSPGELPLLSQPLTDRQTFYAGGEYDLLPRLRTFGGWEAFKSNLYPESASSISTTRPATDGVRGYGGVRVPLGSRSNVALRLEGGDRRARYVGTELTRVSDTGSMTAEWQTGIGAVNALARFSRRENVESASLDGTQTVNETSGHVYFNPTQTLQFFGNATASKTSTASNGGNTHWQFGGGGQSQLFKRSLWLRGEATVGRNIDLLSSLVMPQESLNIGLNGTIGRRTIVGFNFFADQLSVPNSDHGSWISRTSLRVTRSFDTGSPRTAASVVGFGRHSGTGSIAGLVFTDWNANGLQDPDEPPIENIPMRLSMLGNAATGGRGEFAFVDVPIGLHQVGIDLPALPVDFDPPAIAQVQLQLGRGETKRVAFGLVPLGAVGGRVVLDANGNGTADADETAVEGAVLVLDSGARSEQLRKGRFRFEAVRSGAHTIALLRDSLPDGASVVGSEEVPIALTRHQPSADVLFLITIQKRPEVRTVFTPTVPRPEPAPRSTAPRGGNAAVPPPRAPARSANAARSSTVSGERFAIQVAAFDDPHRAKTLARELESAGYPAYIVEPPASDPDAPYRVRVGRYASRDEAARAVSELEKTRGAKLWVIRESTKR